MVFLLEKDRIAAQKKIISILWLQYFVAWLGFHFYHPMMMHFYYRMNLETKCKTVKKNWSIYSSQAYVIRRKISRLQLINDIKRIWRIVYFALNFKHFVIITTLAYKSWEQTSTISMLQTMDQRLLEKSLFSKSNINIMTANTYFTPQMFPTKYPASYTYVKKIARVATEWTKLLYWFAILSYTWTQL